MSCNYLKYLFFSLGLLASPIIHLWSQENIYVDHHIDRAEDLYNKSKYVDAVRELVLAINYIPSNDTATANKIDRFLLKNRDAIILLIKTKDNQTREARRNADTARKLQFKADVLSAHIQRMNKNLFYNAQFALVYNGKKYGYINKNYRVVIPYMYDEARPFDCYGFSKVLYNNNYYLLDTNRTEYFLATDLSNLSTKSKALDISGKGLVEIPAKVFEYNRLNILYCDGNHLVEIPPDIDSLIALSHLFLHDNELEQLPNEVGSLKNLISLEAGNNKIDHLPDSLVMLAKLKELNLYDNNLFHLPNDIGKMKNLEYLDVSMNFLDSLPESLVNLSSLKTLVASNNMISSLPPDMHKMTGLEVLILNNNHLSKIPENLEVLENLRILDLRGNPELNPDELNNLKNELPAGCEFLFDESHVTIRTPRTKK